MSELPESSSGGFKIFLILLAIAVGGMMFWAISSGPQRGSGETWGLAVGKPVPEIAAEGWINGSAPTPEKLSGQVLVVEAWATWCGPCRRVIPELKELHEEYGDQVMFIGLTSEPKSAQSDIQAFVQEFEIPWLIGYGASETLRALDAQYIPITWVIGRDGAVVWNSHSEKTLEEGIQLALNGKQE